MTSSTLTGDEIFWENSQWYGNQNTLILISPKVRTVLFYQKKKKSHWIKKYLIR